MTLETIAIFLPSLAGGGAEQQMVRLANALVARRYPVTLVTATDHDDLSDQLLPEVALARLSARSVSGALPGLVRFLKRAKPDVVLSAMEHANLCAFIACSLTGTRLVASIHENVAYALTHSARPKDKLTYRLALLSYRALPTTVCVSKGVLDECVSRFKLNPDKLRHIYNIALDEKTVLLADEACSHPWFVDKRMPVIVSSGRLSPEKDYPTLIDAFAFLLGKKQAGLIIIGEGQERPVLEERIKRMRLEAHVQLAGWQRNPYKFMKRADLFVISSIAEGMSLVLAEALALSPRLVATDCPSGPREVLENGKYGRLVPPGDPEALARAMLESLSEDPRPIPPEAWQRFTEETVVPQYIDEIGRAVV